MPSGRRFPVRRPGGAQRRVQGLVRDDGNAQRRPAPGCGSGRRLSRAAGTRPGSRLKARCEFRGPIAPPARDPRRSRRAYHLLQRGKPLHDCGIAARNARGAGQGGASGHCRRSPGGGVRRNPPSDGRMDAPRRARRPVQDSVLPQRAPVECVWDSQIPWQRPRAGHRQGLREQDRRRLRRRHVPNPERGLGPACTRSPESGASARQR